MGRWTRNEEDTEEGREKLMTCFLAAEEDFLYSIHVLVLLKEFFDVALYMFLGLHNLRLDRC